MKDLFTILEINKYKEIGGYLIGVDYSERSDSVSWTIVCRSNTDLSDISELLTKSGYSNYKLKRGDEYEEVLVTLKVSEEIKMYAGSYIPKDIEKIYDSIYELIKDYLDKKGE